jgi:hypothetical protein
VNQVDGIQYLRQDGAQIIRADPSSEKFSFLDVGQTRSDFGGIIDDCSTNGVRCLNLSGYQFSFPRSKTVPNEWFVGQTKFSILGRLDRSRVPVWLIQVSVKSDAYMFFSYSRERGVESISLQKEGAARDVAKTYLLTGEQGLLSENGEGTDRRSH